MSKDKAFFFFLLVLVNQKWVTTKKNSNLLFENYMYYIQESTQYLKGIISVWNLWISHVYVIFRSYNIREKIIFLYIHVQMHVKCTCISIHVHLQCMYCSLIRFYQVIDEINSNQLLFPISFLILFYSRVRKTNVYM